MKIAHVDWQMGRMMRLWTLMILQAPIKQLILSIKKIRHFIFPNLFLTSKKKGPNHNIWEVKQKEKAKEYSILLIRNLLN
jgi:hypothetical protein